MNEAEEGRRSSKTVGIRNKEQFKATNDAT